MKSRMNKTIFSLSPAAMSLLLSGCFFGENKTYFDYKDGVNGAGNDLPVIPEDPTRNPSSTLTASGVETETSTSSSTETSVDTGTTSSTSTLTFTGTSTSTGTSTGTSSGTGTSTGTNTDGSGPGYGFCCNINTGNMVPASEMGCNQGLALFPVASQTECNAMVITPVPTPALVCDPFGNQGGTASSTNGIKAKLYYYNSAEVSSSIYQGVNAFIKNAKSANSDLYFSNLHTPTRAFEHGFISSNGSALTTDEGAVLTENFALKFSGGIQLPQGMANKKVQFAVLSDDGAIFSIINGTTKTVVLNNDGNHPTKMACAAAPVEVSADNRVKFEMNYYQGPRKHISLTLIWREWSDLPSFNSNDQWCGKSGNDLFFNSATTPSTAQPAWNDLMTRWEVVPANVFHVDATSETINPCNN